MRSILLLMGILVSAQLAYAQADNADLIQQADSAYASGDYETAQTLYQQVIQSGVRDPAIFFNLGNAYYQSGDLGHALLNYRIVQQYWPRDPDLNRNIALVRAERTDLQIEETGFLEGLAALTTGIATLTELGLLVGAFWTTTFIALAWIIYQPRWRKRLRIPLLILGVILLAGLLLLIGRFQVEINQRQGVVVQSVTQVRSGPGDEYLQLYQLHSGAELHLWDMRDGWVRFALPDGRLGWLPAEAIGIVGQ
jgi:tetratricopeptide (TPR) repeat protein